MKKCILAAIAVTGQLIAFSQDSLSCKLDELMNGFYNTGRFNGSVLVSKKGKVLLEKGYGLKDAESRLPNDACTIYQVASITKTFTAAVILKLLELKKIALSDKLTKFYPGFHKDITIEHLLQHRSGIRNITETDANIPGQHEKELVDYLQKLGPDFSPGTQMHYSNSGYIILGHIISKVTGVSYYETVRQYIFNPLKMRNSGFDFTHLQSKDKALGYDKLSDDKHEHAAMLDSIVPFAAGAIYSTVGDLYKWHTGLQQYSVLEKRTLDKAYEPSIGKNYGFGWQIDSIYGQKMVSHSGAINGFGSNFARIPADDICIVLLSNKSGATFETVNITERLLAVLYGRPYKVPVKKAPIALKEDLLKRYAGTYQLQERPLTIDIVLENGRLMARPHQGPPSPLLPMNQTRFYSETDEELEIEFETDDAGKVFQFKLNHRDRTGIAKKIQ